MSVRGVLVGSLGICAVIGLTLIATGLVPWGIRAVALCTLLGLVWLFLLFLSLGVEIYRR